jgi:hypothetical protein
MDIVVSLKDYDKRDLKRQWGCHIRDDDADESQIEIYVAYIWGSRKRIWGLRQLWNKVIDFAVDFSSVEYHELLHHAAASSGYFRRECFRNYGRKKEEKVISKIEDWLINTDADDKDSLTNRYVDMFLDVMRPL